MTKPTELPREEVVRIPLDQLRESPLNPRRHWNQAKQQEFEQSVRSKGIINPMLVRPQNGHFEIGSGHRRFRAAKAAGLAEAPAIVRPMDDVTFLELIVLGNLQEDPHPIDEAAGFENLLLKAGYTVETLAARIGRSEGYIYQRLKLCQLIPAAQTAFLEDRISTAHALQIARLQPQDQAAALKNCFDERWMGHDQKREQVLISGAELRVWIRQNLLLDLHAAPFSKIATELHPTAGSCLECPKRTGFAPALFPDLGKQDLCTDRKCFDQKLQTHIHIKIEAHQEQKEPLLQLSEEWNGKAKKGVVAAHQWTTPTRKQDRCAHLVSGIVVDGDRRKGQTLEVCISPKCAKHRRGIVRDPKADAREREKQKAVEAELKAERAFRTRVLDAILDRAPAQLAGEELRIVALGIFRRMWNDRQRVIAKRRGWSKDKKAAGNSWEASAAQFLRTADNPAMVGFLLEVMLVDLTDPGRYYPGAGVSRNDDQRKELLDHARRYKVDVDAIGREGAAESRQRRAVARAHKPALAITDMIQPKPKKEKKPHARKRSA
jgi:ParB family chromosome partitioning protein